MKGPTRRTTLRAGALLGVLLAAFDARAGELTSSELLIRGSRLLITPAEQTTAPGLPCRLETSLAGAPGDPRVIVVGELSGPGLDRPLRLTAPPNEPLQIPGLRLEGDYEIVGLRLERDGLPLLWAEPERATIHVRQLLVNSVTSRPLTPAELARYGVSVGSENYRAYSYSVGFAIGSRVVTLDFPLVFDELGRLLEGPPEEQYPFALPDAGPGDALPSVEPFQLEEVPAPDLDPGERESGGTLRVFGLVVIPNDVAFLNQFFSVLLVIQNGADAGSAVTLRDISATAHLPAQGLREARTVPARPFGTSVPVLVPGPDGEAGTADDLTIVVAQGAGQAEWVVEGIKEGTHAVDFEITATADGLTAGTVPLTGSARGVVLVRDPRFALTFVHPSVVRAGERYLLRTVIANTSTTPVYELSVRLPAHLLQGAVLVGEDRVTIGELPPGEEAVAEFSLEATVTGRVTATAFNSSDPLTARFELSAGVGELGIPLSPETLALPGYVDALPKRLVDPALSLLGLAHSLAKAPAWSLEAGLPPLGEVGVRRRAQDLAGHALRVRAGEPVERALAGLGLTWLGAGAPDPQFELLRRGSRRNAAIYSEVAAALSERVSQLGGDAALGELEELLVGAGPALVVRARGAGFGGAARLVLSGRSSNSGAAGQAADTMIYRRELAYAELLDIDSPAWQGEVGIVGSWAEDAGYQVQLHGTHDGSVDLEIVRVEADGTTWRWVAPGLATSPCSLLTVDVAAPAAPAATRSYSRCTGALTDAHDVAAVQQAAPVARIVAARQDTSLNPTGRDVVLVLSQSAANLDSWDAERALVASRLQAGGMTIERERLGIAAFTQFDPRVVVLALGAPLNSGAELALSVSGLPLATGGVLDAVDVPVGVDPRLRFGVVRGQVIGSDGAPLAGVQVELFETDFRCFGMADGCGWASSLTDTVTADATGSFLLDAVRYRDEPPDARIFTLRVETPGGESGRAAGVLLAPDTVQKIDLVLLGRGSVRGHLYRDDGSPLRDPLVQARSIDRPWEGGSVRPAADGSFSIGGLPVGPVQMFGRDGSDIAFATTAIDRAGAVSDVVLVLTRRQPVPRGQITGSVVSQRDGAPRAGVEVYLRPAVAGGITHRAVTDTEGRFAMSDVPAGNAELSGFDPALGRFGFTVPLTVIADRVNAVQAVFADGAGRVRGTVRQLAAGQLSPVAGAVVSALGSAAWARTDAAGAYLLDGVPLGDVTVSAQAPPPPAGTGQRAAAVVRLGTEGQEVTLDLMLESRSGSVVGTVLDSEGRTVGGVTVNRVGAGVVLESVRTGVDGRFSFQRLGPGTHRLDAVRSGRELGSGTATVLYDGHRAETTLRLGSWGAVRLLVRQRTAGGEEVPVKAQVRFGRLTGATGVIEPGPLEVGETGEDGVLLIDDVPDGPFSADAWTLGTGRSAWGGALAFPAHETRDVALVLDAFGRVAGTVLDHTGERGVAGAEVRIFYGPNGAQSQTVATSNEQGHAGEFRFDLVPQGTIRLEVTAGGRAALYHGGLSEPGQLLDDLRLTLSPLSGAVQARLAVCGGSGTGTARVVARNGSLPFLPERVLAHDLADPAPVVLSGLPAGAWTLRVSSALHGDAMTSFDVVEEGVGVDVGELCLAPTGRISGVVLDPRTGVPATAVQVRVLAPGPYFSLRPVSAATTGSDGRFVFDGLPISGHGWGRYGVQAFDPASARGALASDLDLAAAPGHAIDLTVTLEALGSVRGTVRLASGEPVGDARVQLTTAYRLGENLSSSVDTFATLATRAGEYRFDGVPQGPFRVEAHDPGRGLRREVAGELQHEGEVVSLDVALPPTASVTGTLREPSGTPVGGAVTLTQHEYLQRGSALAVTSRDNPYGFDGVVSGPFKLIGSASLERSGALWPYAGSLDATMPDPPADQVIDVELAARANLRVVVRQSGVAQAGAAVQASGGPAGESATREQTSQADGSAFFAALPQAAYTVSARYTPPGQIGAIGAVRAIAVEPQHDGGTLDVALDLAPAGGVRLQALAPDTTPAAGALATVLCADGMFQAVADGGGAVSFLAVPQGVCRLEVQDDDSDGVFRDDIVTAVGGELDLGVVALDAVDPAVASSTPVVGATGVAVDAELVLHFTEPLRPGSVPGSVALRGPGNASVSIAPALDPDGTAIGVQPASPLVGETGYVLEVSRQVTDLAGRPLVVAFVLPFRTADVTRPRVVAVSPPDDPAGARRALPDVTPVVTFSEPIAAGSVSAESLRLLVGGGTAVVGVTLRVEREGFDVRLIPPSGLVPDGTYRIEATTAVTDLAGNPLEAPFASSFRVTTITPPSVTLLPPLGAVVDGEAWQVREQQPVTLRATAASDDPLAAVGFAVNGADVPGTVSLDGASGEWRMPWTVARLADLGGGAALSAFALDVSGNRGNSAAHPLTVTVNAPPTGTLRVTPETGVLPNHEVIARVAAQDDHGLTRIAVSFTGACVRSEVRSVTGTNTAGEVGFACRCPSNAASGTAVSLRAEITDTEGQTTVLGPTSVTVLADAAAPLATTLEPAAGASFAAGADVAFRFALTDDVLVSTLTLTVGGEPVWIRTEGAILPGTQWTATATASWQAPAVTATQQFHWVLTAADPAGHTTSVEGDITVTPLPPGPPPVVVIACPTDGDPVVGGNRLRVRFSAQASTSESPTNLIASYRLLIDGAEVLARGAVDRQAITAVEEWTPPADAAVGRMFQVRVEARDLANVIGGAEVAVAVPAGTVLRGAQALDASRNGATLVLADGTFTAVEPLDLAGLVVLGGANVVGEPGEPLDLDVAGAVHVACDAAIDMSGRGYAGGTSAAPAGLAPDDVSGSQPAAGGSHGGVGALVEGNGPAGESFGSVVDPVLAGGGGAASVYGVAGTPGGGVVSLRARQLVVNGAVQANGARAPGGWGGAAGAGGSIAVEVDSVRGGGTVEADGGWFQPSSYAIHTHGAGGGGRVAITAAEQDWDLAAQVRARGGESWSDDAYGRRRRNSAGAGTVFVLVPGANHGELVVDQGGPASGAVGLTPMPVIGSGAIGEVTSEGDDAWMTPQDPAARFSLGVVGMWVRTEAGDFRVAAQESRRRILLAGAADAVHVGDRYEGVWKLDALTVRGRARVQFDDRAEIGSVTVAQDSVVSWANLDAPRIDAALVTMPVSYGQFHVAGSAGAIGDADGIATARLRNAVSGWSTTISLGPQGSFAPVTIYGATGDAVEITATDAHGRPRSTTVAVGALPANTGAPAVDLTRIRFAWCTPYPGPGSPPGPGSAPGVRAAGLEPCVIGDLGAIADDEPPVRLRLRNLATSVEYAGYVDREGDFAVMVQGSRGDAFTLTATDSHPLPLATTVDVGMLPAPPVTNAPPVVDAGTITLLPLGFGFQVVGRPGAVTDADRPVSVVLTSLISGVSTAAVTVERDGSFYARFDGTPGDEIVVVATDGHPSEPASSDPVSLGLLPDLRPVPATEDLEGRVPTALRDGFTLVDGGTAVWWLSGVPDGVDGRLYAGLGEARDAFFNLKLRAPMALDGGDLVGWVEEGEPAARVARRVAVSGGTLVRAQVRGGETLLLAEEADGIRLIRMSTVADSGGSWAPDCDALASDLLLDGTTGLRALELLPAPDGLVAVLTDDPAAELHVADVASPASSEPVGAIDLPGGSPPRWGRWQTGELHLGRADGTVELWRWAAGGPELHASFTPGAGVARATMRFGDQLWVGLDDGRLVQVDLTRQLVVGEIALGDPEPEPIVGMARDGSLLRVATALHVFTLELGPMPPTIVPEQVAWGHAEGRSWAGLALPEPGAVEVRGWWDGGAAATWEPCAHCLGVVDEDVGAPPTLTAVTWEGVPSPPYVPPSVTLRGFDAGTVPELWLGPVGHGAASCDASRGTLGAAPGASTVLWRATGLAGEAGVAWSTLEEGSGERSASMLATAGGLREVFEASGYLVVIDDGVRVLAVDAARGGNPVAPLQVQQLALGIAAPQLARRVDFGPLLLAASEPARLAVVDLAPLETGAGSVTVVADNVALPEIGGPILDLVAGGGRLFVLTAEGSTGRIFRYSFGDPAAPQFLDARDVTDGAPATSLAYRLGDGTAGDGESLVVVRHGWGIELLTPELATLASLPLPGTPRGAYWNWGLYVLLGDWGVARISGPSAEPFVDFLQSNHRTPGDARRAGDHSVVTPEGLTWF